METNTLPAFDMSVNTTGCCPKFNPDGWDDQDLHFRDKPFVRAKTRSILHMPINMGSVFSRVQNHIKASDAAGAEDYFVLSRDTSAWRSEHLFAVPGPVPDEEMTSLSGDFVTKVFEGPYRHVRAWEKQLRQAVRARGSDPKGIHFFYTTCPKCAKAYGKNYVVGVAEV